MTSFGFRELIGGQVFIVCEFLAQGFENAWHCYDNVDPLLLYDGDDFGRLVRFAEINFRAEELGKEDTHQLSKDVAEWQQAEKTQRMYESFPTRVLLEFLFDWGDVREEIAMGEANAFGFGGSAGSKDDLDQIVWLHGNGAVRIVRVSCNDFRKIIERQTRYIDLRLRLIRQ